MNFETDVKKSVKELKNGGLILYPTDTIWGIGCDATNANSVSRIYDIKQRDYSKSLIVLVSDLKMLKKIVETIPDKAQELINTSERPITIVYLNAKKIAKNVISYDGTIAVRIPKDEFCIQLIKKFKKPIISTSANISGENAPQNFSNISSKIKESVDYIVNYKQEDNSENEASIIVKIENKKLVYIRK